MITRDVTTIEDDGSTGSLRAALEGDTRNGVKIRICKPGNIFLKRAIAVKGRYDIEIVGCQEGEGTSVVGDQTGFDEHCSSVRITDMRFRASIGHSVDTLVKKYMLGSKDFGNRSLVIMGQDFYLKRVSAELSTDDDLGFWGSNCIRATAELCIIGGGLGLNRMACLASVSPTDQIVQSEHHVKFKHCLFVRSQHRTPKLAGGRSMLKGCVIVGQLYGSEFDSVSADIVGNYFCPSPALRTKCIIMAPPTRMVPGGLFVKDNWLRLPNTVLPTALTSTNEWNALVGDSMGGSLPKTGQKAEPWFGAESTEGMLGKDAYNHVIANAGPRIRDEIDRGFVEYAKAKATSASWA